ncbi:MAG: RNA methyltransferase [Caldiserica bacterium]|nr:RNA methyltransferase [Caldisericota bacterium]
MVTRERMERIERVVAGRLKGLAVVCENFANPHNAAAILRTCEALGILNVYIIEELVPFEPSRAITQGAEKWLFVKRFRRAERAFPELKEAGYRVYAAMPGRGALAVEELPVGEPLALVFGNERDGVSAKALGFCDGTFRIPMWGFVESFNVSVAAAISLYISARRRRDLLGTEGDLTPREREALRERYVELSR